MADLWDNYCWKVDEFPSGSIQIRHYVWGASTYEPTLCQATIPWDCRDLSWGIGAPRNENHSGLSNFMSCKSCQIVIWFSVGDSIQSSPWRGCQPACHRAACEQRQPACERGTRTSSARGWNKDSQLSTRERRQLGRGMRAASASSRHGTRTARM